MMPLVRDLLRHDVQQPEDDDPDDRHEEDHDDRQDVGEFVFGLWREQGRGGASGQQQERYQRRQECQAAYEGGAWGRRGNCRTGVGRAEHTHL
jgi:hypothetical protein